MFCNKCGSKVTDGARFCSKCGNSFERGSEPAPLNASAQYSSFQVSPQPVYSQQSFPQPSYGTPQGNTATTPAPPKKKRTKTLLIGVGAIIIIVIAVVLVITLSGSEGKSSNVGTWISPAGYEYIFEKDGTLRFGYEGVVFEDTGEYFIEGNRITIKVWGATESAKFKISGDKLTFTDDNGVKATYKRKK